VLAKGRTLAFGVMDGQVVPGRLGVRVVWAEDPLVNSQGGFVQRDHLVQPAHVVVGVGQVAAGGQG
jgi:hypothetical protein